MKKPHSNSLHWSVLLWNSRGLVKNPIPYHQKWFDQYGDTLRFRFFNGQKVFLTRDPELALHVLKKNHKNYHKSDVTSNHLGQYIGKGLLTLNGEEWKKDRRLLQPGFYKERIRDLFDTTIPQAIKKGMERLPTGTTLDSKPFMNRLAFEVVTKALFDVHLHSDILEEIRHIIDAVQEHFAREVRQPQWQFWRYINGAKKQANQQVLRIRAIMQQLINDRKASNRTHNDLLELMLSTTYEDGSPMEADRIIDELIILIVAGHETTANALCYMAYELAKNSRVFDKVVTEVDATAPQATPYEQLGQLRYGMAVVQECLRKYPPAWIVDRKSLKDDKVGQEPIPSHSFVAISIYELHHHPDYWEAPERFDPDRFMTPPPAVYLPFGAGPRMCIGHHFALYEMLEVLRHWAQNYTLHFEGNQPPEMRAKITLQPQDMQLRFEHKNG